MECVVGDFKRHFIHCGLAEVSDCKRVRSLVFRSLFCFVNCGFCSSSLSFLIFSVDWYQALGMQGLALFVLASQMGYHCHIKDTGRLSALAYICHVTWSGREGQFDLKGNPPPESKKEGGTASWSRALKETLRYSNNCGKIGYRRWWKGSWLSDGNVPIT
jgi:hypothetical protein